jgi:DNA repair exonuclease SbcCD ATPase subunit
MENSLLMEMESWLVETDRILSANEANINLLKENQRKKDNCEKKLVEMEEEMDIVSHAIEIVSTINDSLGKKTIEFLEHEVNCVLERIFVDSPRSLVIEESLRGGKNPQLTFKVKMPNGRIRRLHGDSGHGLAQIISIISILSLITLTGSRRLLAMDEIFGGVSENNKEILTEVLKAFGEIGFQYIIVEHGFIPDGAKVYELSLDMGTAKISKEYFYHKEDEEASDEYDEVVEQ